jgi:hypothetical protein
MVAVVRPGRRNARFLQGSWPACGEWAGAWVRPASRLSSEVEPAGTVAMDWGTGPQDPVAIQNTTHNRHLERQELDQHYFDRGTRRFTVHFTAPD